MIHFPFAYVGPGAGFAFLGSFLSLLLSLLAGLASLLLWPFRALAGLFRKSVRRKVVIVGVDGLRHDAAERLVAEGALPNLARLKRLSGSPGQWPAAAFWRVLGKHSVDSTVLWAPGELPPEFKGRMLRRSAGSMISRPAYYAKYLVRLLGPLSVLSSAQTAGAPCAEQEAVFFSALDRQKRGLLACVFEIPDGAYGELDRIVGRLLAYAAPETTVFLLFGGTLFSNRGIGADSRTEDVASLVLRIFGIGFA